MPCIHYRYLCADHEDLKDTCMFMHGCVKQISQICMDTQPEYLSNVNVWLLLVSYIQVVWINYCALLN